MKTRASEWDKQIEEAKKEIEDVLEACANPSLRKVSAHMQEKYDEFYALTETLLNCEQNPYGFLEDGSYLDSWESAAGFISTLFHSCIDDGDHCFLSDTVHGPKLVFRCRYEHSHEDLYYKVNPLAKEIRLRPERSTYVPHEEGEFHSDYKRFISELLEFPEATDKKRKNLKAKGETDV